MSVIIIGGGMTGWSISRSLSQASIPHYLFCPPPHKDSPRLGESLNLEGTLDFDVMFGDFRKYFHSKQYISFASGDKIMSCNMDGERFPKINKLVRSVNYKPFSRLHHIDRINFDCALFDSVLSSSYCRHKNLKIKDIKYSNKRDIVESVVADNNEKFDCDYVFDATTYMGILPKFTKKNCTIMGSKKRVVFTHFFPNGSEAYDKIRDAKEQPAWLSATTIVRMHHDIDGVDALCWCIPLGLSYISIGLAYDYERYKDLEDKQVMNKLLASLQRLNIPVESIYPKMTKMAKIDYYHYVHKKAYGKNWLLSGSSAQQIWFPSSSGVSLGTLASALAPHIVKQPIRYGKYYQRIHRSYTKLHNAYEKFFIEEKGDSNFNVLTKFLSRLVGTSLQRVVLTGIAKNKGVKKNILEFFLFVINIKIRNDTLIDIESISQRTIKGEYSSNKQTNDFYKKRVLNVLETVQSLRPIDRINDYINHDVNIFVNGKKFSKIVVWKNFVLEIQRCVKKRNAKLFMEDIQIEKRLDFFHARAKVYLLGKNKQRIGKKYLFRVTYKFHNDKVSHIWVTKHNYIAFFGEKIVSPLYFYLLFCFPLYIKAKVRRFRAQCTS